MTLTQTDPINLRAVAISGGAVILTLVSRRLVKRFHLPQLDMLFVLVAVAGAAYLCGWSQAAPGAKPAIALIETVPASLPLPHIPKAALAGLLLVAAARLIDIPRLRYILRGSRYDAVLLLTTAIAALAIGVEFSILIGVILSVLWYIPRASKLKAEELVVTPERVVRARVASDPLSQDVLIFTEEDEEFSSTLKAIRKAFALHTIRATPATEPPLDGHEANGELEYYLV